MSFKHLHDSGIDLGEIVFLSWNVHVRMIKNVFWSKASGFVIKSSGHMLVIKLPHGILIFINRNIQSPNNL